MSAHGDPLGIRQCYFRIPKDQIAYVRFVLEAYDGLAQVTSLPGRGEMEWLVPLELINTAEELAQALATEAHLIRISRPKDWPTDLFESGCGSPRSGQSDASWS